MPEEEFTIYEDPHINWTWYNVETKGGAISFRFHNNSDEQALLEHKFGDKIKPGASCPIPWVDYTKVKNNLRNTEFDGLKPVLDFINKLPEGMGKGIKYYGVSLACPCNKYVESYVRQEAQDEEFKRKYMPK